MIKKNILYVVISHLLLLSAIFVDTSSFAKEDLRAEDQKNEEIISILQEGIDIIKDEIQRDEEVASHMVLRNRAFQRLRSSLKEGFVPKEKLLEDLKLVLASKLPEEIESLQETIDREKKIVQMRVSPIGVFSGKRERRITRLMIKESIPSKKKVLASFKKTLREFEKLLSEAPPEKMEHQKISSALIKYKIMLAFVEKLNLWQKEKYGGLYFFGTDADKLYRTKEKFIQEMEERPYILQYGKSMASNIEVDVVSPVSAMVTAKVGYIIKDEYKGRGDPIPYDLAKNIYNGATITQTFKMTLEEGSWRMSHTQILFPRASTN